MHTKDAEMNTSGETRIDSVPLPEPGFVQHGACGGPYTADQLRAYGDERARAAASAMGNELRRANAGYVHELNRAESALARVAELESMLRMIATRAQTFPYFPIGWHIPEVFNAVGMQMPERPENDDTHDGLRARVEELEAKLAEADKAAALYRTVRRQNRFQIAAAEWVGLHGAKDLSERCRKLDDRIAAIAAGGGDGS